MYILHLVQKNRYPFIDDAIDRELWSYDERYLWDWSDYALSGLREMRRHYFVGRCPTLLI